MKIGLVGLGKMGQAITHRLVQAGHNVAGFDMGQQARQQARESGVEIVTTLEELATKARIIWIMVPQGEPVDQVIEQLLPNLRSEDILIDGGNSLYKDTIRRHQALQEKKIHFLDCGTSGGVHGRDIGFSLMVGGDQQVFEKIIPLFAAVAAPDGFGYMGPAGAGHYVKMVHNGIEYALLQAYGEGLDLLKNGHYPNLDLEKVTKVWANGSIIRSWIVELAHEVFEQDQTLEHISGYIAENKTGQWTSQAAHEKNVPVKLIDEALAIRAWSRSTGGNFGTKVVAMLRNKFGGHTVKKNEEE